VELGVAAERQVGTDKRRIVEADEGFKIVVTRGARRREVTEEAGPRKSKWSASLVVMGISVGALTLAKYCARHEENQTASPSVPAPPAPQAQTTVVTAQPPAAEAVLPPPPGPVVLDAESVQAQPPTPVQGRRAALEVKCGGHGAELEVDELRVGLALVVVKHPQFANVTASLLNEGGTCARVDDRSIQCECRVSGPGMIAGVLKSNAAGTFEVRAAYEPYDSNHGGFNADSIFYKLMHSKPVAVGALLAGKQHRFTFRVP
jgi:hypothetical protein